MNRKDFLLTLLDTIGFNVIGYTTYGNGGEITIKGMGDVWFFNDKTKHGHSLKFKANDTITSEMIARIHDIENFMALLGIEYDINEYSGHCFQWASYKALRIKFIDKPWKN